MTKKNMERFTYPLTIKKADIPNAYHQRRLRLEEELSRFQPKPSDGELVDLDTDILFKTFERDVRITGSRLSNVDISQRQFDNLILIDCDATGLIAEGVTIDKLILIRTQIEDANFQNAHIANAIMVDVTAANSNFQRAMLARSWLQGNFQHAAFDEADISESILEGNFQDVSFQRGKLIDCWLRSSDIQHSNFFEAEVEGITLDLVQAGVNTVILPDGSLYVPISNTFRNHHR